MASGIIHLAVTKRICEKRPCKDRARLDFAVILPDFSADRQRAHRRSVVWGRNKRTYDLNGFREQFSGKMQEDDLYLGYYLHLVQDVCYRHFVYDRHHWNPSIPGNVEKLHNDYAILNRYVRENYGLQNSLCVPSGFGEEELNTLAPFYPEGAIEEMGKYFTQDGEGDIFFFTREMADIFIEEAAEECLRELEALERGTSVMDGYDLAWENPPYSLLETTRNTRDIDGYRIGGTNRYTKPFRFLRSDAALEPSAKDVSFLRSNGVTTVIDTRTLSEAAQKPHGLSETEGFTYLNFPIEEGASIPESVEAVPGSYVQIAHGKQVGDIFRAIANAEGGVIENCSAGKDRTGVITALLLWLCGVRKSDIVYDYVRTKQNNAERFKLILSYNPNIDMNIVIPRESFLTDFMDLIEKEHGSVQSYFSSVGIGPELQEKLIRKLCE